jgi:hypothetical protein
MFETNEELLKQLSSKFPKYELIDDVELKLTIFAAE